MPFASSSQCSVVEFLRRCQSSTGGFGGGPGQIPHLAPTYAAVLTLCEIGTREAYDAIDRVSLQRFLYSLHQEDGSFVMHEDGEVDIRGVYCAAVVAQLTNISSSELFLNSGQWIASCQTYEGGFSAVPGTEAHGGYTFCGYAAAILLQKQHLVDHQAVLKWASRRQMTVEGGFQGRTNKLVDSCYSFWVGGVFPLVYLCLKQLEDSGLPEDCWHFDQLSLQKYVLYCCQRAFGGLVDKPGKSRDYYHTCYGLSGVSIAQHCPTGQIQNLCEDEESLLKPTHPIFNITVDQAEDALKHFKSLSTLTLTTTAVPTETVPSYAATVHTPMTDAM
jgi:protein farnesyltransferase subunit beta